MRTFYSWDEVKAKPEFQECVYVSKTVNNHTGVTNCWEVGLEAHNDLEDAVPKSGEETEVGIYQLVRVARFKKTAVEQVTLTEVKP